MAATPTVSVIVPAYNRERFVGEAVRSALSQSYDSLEVVVVDDGSTDGTAAAVGAIGDRRVRYLHQQHRGIGAARNRGIRVARGRYVAFLDSDDLWLPGLLAAEVPVLEDRPAVGLVHARAQAMGADGRPRPQLSGAPLRFPGRPLSSLLYGDTVSSPTALTRRSCLERVGLCDESIVARVDWDLWLRIARHADIFFVDQVLARFRQHAERTTGRGAPHYQEVIRSRVLVLDRFYAAPGVPAEAEEVRRSAYRNAHIEAGVQWLRTGGWSQARRSFAAAITTAPTPWTTPARIAWVLLVHTVLTRSRSGVRVVTVASALMRRARRPARPR